MNKLNTLKSFYSTHSPSENPYNLHNELNWIQTGGSRHYPPATREWNNSVYNFNKNSHEQSLIKYMMLNKLVKGYLNMGKNLKLARSKRMRYLRTKSKSKKLYVSRPEVKQTSDKIIVTVYYYDKLKHNFIRKLFFFNRTGLASALTNKKIKRNILLKKRKLLKRYMPYSGVKYIKEIKLFKDRNVLKNKYMEQSILFLFFKYLFSLLNIYIYSIELNNPSDFKTINNEREKIKNAIKAKPLYILWIDYANCTLENIELNNINYKFLNKKIIDCYNSIDTDFTYKDKKTNLNFRTEINKKLWVILKGFLSKNITSIYLISKILNYISLNINKYVFKRIFKKRVRKISKLVYLYNNNFLRLKKLLPVLKMSIDNLYNKKAELNLINLKYFYLNSDTFTQVVTTKIRKKKSPLITLKRSLSKIKVSLYYNIRKKIVTNNMNKLFDYNNLSLISLPLNLLQDNKLIETSKDWLQTVFDRLFPHSFMNNYFNPAIKYNKISSILNNIKYKKILGIRVEANGRLTRRNTAARAQSLLIYKGNLKDREQYVNMTNNDIELMSALLLRNSQRPNTQFTFNKSKRRIGAFGIKTWISAK